MSMRGITIKTICGWCETEITAQQPSVLVPVGQVADTTEMQEWHEICDLRSKIGSPAHLLGKCDPRCGGDGTMETDGPQTPEEKYEEARESARLWYMGYS